MITEEKLKNIINEAVQGSENRINKNTDNQFSQLTLVLDGHITGLKQYIDADDDSLIQEIRNVGAISEDIRQAIKVGNEGFNLLNEKIDINHKQIIETLGKQDIRVSSLERLTA